MTRVKADGTPPIQIESPVEPADGASDNADVGKRRSVDRPLIGPATSASRAMTYANLDQRMRFDLIAQVLDAVLPTIDLTAQDRSDAGPRVLDLGSGPVDAIGDLIGRECVIRCDTLDMPGDDRYVQLDADRPLPLPFGDDSFDVVIASEVLEHVPDTDREEFVRECARVASVAVVLTHPHNDPRVRYVETLAMKDYAARNKREHPYLLEHRDYGLPESGLAAKVFESLGHRPVQMMNAALDDWLAGILVGERLTEMAVAAEWLDRSVRLMSEDTRSAENFGSYRVMTAVGLTSGAADALRTLVRSLDDVAIEPEAGKMSPTAMLESAIVRASEGNARLIRELVEANAEHVAGADASRGEVGRLVGELTQITGERDALQASHAELEASRAALEQQSIERQATIDRITAEIAGLGELREQERQAAADALRASQERLALVEAERDRIDQIVNRLQRIAASRRDRASAVIASARQTRAELVDMAERYESSVAIQHELRASQHEDAERIRELTEQLELTRDHAREVVQKLGETTEQLAHTRNKTDYTQKGFDSAAEFPMGPASAVKQMLHVGPWHGRAKSHGDISPTDAPQMWGTSTGGGHLVLGVPRGTALIRIRVRLTASQPSSAVIRFDCGHGHDPNAELRFPHAERGVTVDRIVRLNEPLRAVMLQPLTTPGEVRLEEFMVRPASRAELAASLVAWRFRGARTPAGVARTIRHAVGKVRREGFEAVKGAMRAYSSGSDRYSTWLGVNEVTPDDVRAMREEAAGWAAPPMISVLTPLYNTPEKLLREMVESVMAQAYENWELICVDDCSPDPTARHLVAEYAKKDSRIKLICRETNGNISAATNDALDAATGEYIALLDHDDVIYPHALYSMVREIVHDRSLDWIYSDEDKLYPDGSRRDPFFKPDWSPFYLTSCMYTCHLTAYRASLVREVGGFRSDYDGAQDYDLALRMMRAVPPERIRHVADVLYSWRLTEGSTAMSPDSKPWAYQSIGRTLNENLAHWSTPGKSEPGPTQGFSRARFPIQGDPKVSLVIPTASGKGMYGGEEDYYLARLLRSVRKLTTYENLEIVVVDNGDMPEDLRAVADETGARVLHFTKPFNLATKINDGAWAATGDHIVLLNDDIEVVTPDWIERMLEFSQQTNHVGAVGAKLLFPDGKLQHSGCIVLGGNPGHAYYRQPPEHPGYFLSNQVVREFVAVTGACVMTPAKTYKELGGFDESFPLNFNDVDYCLRLRERGLLSVQMPDVELIHYEGVSKSGTHPDELERFHKRWKDKLPYDPHHNPNLSTHSGDFELPDAPVNARLRRGRELKHERATRE